MIRRDFVRMFGFVAASLGLGTVGNASTVVGTLGGHLRDRHARPVPGSMASFQHQVGQWFYVESDRIQPLQLTSVEPGPDTEGLEQFSLYFRGALKVELDEGLYRVQSAQRDIDEIYLQPVGATERGRIYKAPFAKLQSTHTFQEYQ